MIPHVTVIIPVFNKEAHLGDCLESVLNQSLKAIEIICIDDASQDQSLEILSDYARRDARLRLIENPVNIGPGKSRNRGIDAAEGTFLQFIDADDLLPRKSLETLHSRALAANADLVKGSLATFSNDDPSMYQEVSAVPDKIRTELSSEKDLWIPWWHTSYLISSDLVRNNDLRYPDLIAGEDPVFLASVLVNARRLSLVDEIVYFYRKHPKTTGSDGTTIRHATDFIEHAAITKELLTAYYPDCWYRGYGPSLLKNLQWFLERFELDASQKSRINIELARIWGKDAFNL